MEPFQFKVWVLKAIIITTLLCIIISLLVFVDIGIDKIRTALDLPICAY